MRLSAWLAACCSAGVTLAGCGGASGGGGAGPKLVLGPGEHVSTVPTHDPLRQTVSVAYLMPETEIGVDVISGRVYMASEVSLLPARYRLPEGQEGVIGLVDPQFHDQIFTYRSNAIPGQEAWQAKFGAAPAPAPGKLAEWAPPRLVTRGDRPVDVVLADGRRVALASDSRGRVIAVHAETTRHEPLLTVITYRPRSTTVAGPAGVTRTYDYDGRDRITAVIAPGAAAHAPEDAVDGLLDSRATAKRLRYRLRSGTAERYAAYRVAPNAIGENNFAWPSVGGYQQYGVTTRAEMRRVDGALRDSGVLDVAEAIPILNDRVENYSQEKEFERISAGKFGCDIGHPEYGFTYGLKTTRAEIATIASRLAHAPDRWIYIHYSKQRSFCATFG
jgi:YD repeat-containing protein